MARRMWYLDSRSWIWGQCSKTGANIYKATPNAIRFPYGSATQKVIEFWRRKRNVGGTWWRPPLPRERARVESIVWQTCCRFCKQTKYSVWGTAMAGNLTRSDYGLSDSDSFLNVVAERLYQHYSLRMCSICSSLPLNNQKKHFPFSCASYPFIMGSRLPLSFHFDKCSRRGWRGWRNGIYRQKILENILIHFFHIQTRSIDSFLERLCRFQ